MIDLLIQIFFSFIATIGFAVIINIPHEVLLYCGIVGSCGWLSYIGVRHLSFGNMLANLVGALIIGILSMIMARYRKYPMILFNIPSLVPLVPGGQAFHAVQYFALGNNQLAIEYLVQVAMIAGAISMGLFLAELIAQLYFKVSK